MKIEKENITRVIVTSSIQEMNMIIISWFVSLLISGIIVTVTALPHILTDFIFNALMFFIIVEMAILMFTVEYIRRKIMKEADTAYKKFKEAGN